MTESGSRRAGAGRGGAPVLIGIVLVVLGIPSAVVSARTGNSFTLWAAVLLAAVGVVFLVRGLLTSR